MDYYAKYDEWVYTCYNGGCPNSSGNIQSLYAHVMGVSWKEANDELSERKYDSDKIKKRLEKRTQYVEEEDQQGVLDLELSDCLSLSSVPDGKIQTQYHNILKRFYVNRWVPTRYNLMIAYTGKYKNRIIVPVYHENEMIYFQGRAISDDMLPKYLNPVVKKEEIVLNAEHFDPEKYIIITEGLIDAFMVEDHQGTSCLGAGISDEFLDRIFPYTNKGVIIALDNPKLDESGFKNYEKLVEESKYARKLKYFFMPNTVNKDLNDLKLGNKSLNIYEFVVNNSCDYFKACISIKNVV